MVCLVYLIILVQTNTQDRSNRPDQPDSPLSSCPASGKTGVPPLFQQRNAAHQLRNGRLIDPAACSFDEFCIELAMIDTGLSRHGTDEGTMQVSQFILPVMERRCRLCAPFTLTA